MGRAAGGSMYGGSPVGLPPAAPPPPPRHQPHLAFSIRDENCILRVGFFYYKWTVCWRGHGVGWADERGGTFFIYSPGELVRIRGPAGSCDTGGY